MKKIDLSQIDQKKVKIIAGSSVVAAVALYCIYAFLPLAYGGTHSITHKDVASYRSSVKALSAVAGNDEIPTYEDAIKTIAISYAQYDILKIKGAQFEQSKIITALESESPYKGVLRRLKSDMGDERYFSTVALPALIGRPFLEYYNANDPQTTRAREIMTTAINSSFTAGAEKAGLPVKDITIPAGQDTAALYEAASKSIGKTVDKLIDNGNSYMIVQSRSQVGDKIAAGAIIVPKTPPQEFFLAQIKANNVKLEVAPWCVYSNNKFFKPAEPAPKAQAKAEDGPSNEKK
jgi:hypothetical protein